MLRLVVTASPTGPDRGEHRDVHGEVGERHHGRTRDGAAGTDVSLAPRLADPRAAVPGVLDGHAAVGIEHLRKFGAQAGFELVDRERGRPGHWASSHSVVPLAGTQMQLAFSSAFALVREANATQICAMGAHMQFALRRQPSEKTA